MGSLRIKFKLRCVVGNNFTASGQIYKNDNPVGTVRTTNSTTAIEYIEDIDGWKQGDILSIYIWKETAEINISDNYAHLNGLTISILPEIY